MRRAARLSCFSASLRILHLFSLARKEAFIERSCSTPPHNIKANFQDLLSFQGSASIAAGIPPLEEAHSALLQEPCATAVCKARRGALRPPTPKRRSQQAEQLSLFPGLGALGG